MVLLRGDVDRIEVRPPREAAASRRMAASASNSFDKGAVPANAETASKSRRRWTPRERARRGRSLPDRFDRADRHTSQEKPFRSAIDRLPAI